MMTLAKCKQTQLQQTRYTVHKMALSRDSFAGLFQLGIISGSNVLWFLRTGQIGLVQHAIFKEKHQSKLCWLTQRTGLLVHCRAPSRRKAKRPRDICNPKTQSPITLWPLHEPHYFVKFSVTMAQAPIISGKQRDKSDPKKWCSKQEGLEEWRSNVSSRKTQKFQRKRIRWDHAGQLDYVKDFNLYL